MRTLAKNKPTPFAVRLRALREEAALTQKEVALSLGVGIQTYMRWERGETEPAFSELAALAELFDVTLNDFLPASEEP